jgi:hypothetical protein
MLRNITLKPLLLLMGIILFLGITQQVGFGQEKKKSNKEELVEVEVKGITLQPLTHMPVMLLLDREQKRALPIVIGAFEAKAIALEMEHITTPRPMTHDLIKNILDGVKAKIKKVVITDLKEGTFYAIISLRLEEGNMEITVDSRPSDAIAIALRVKSPIFVTQKIMDDPTTIKLDEEQLKKEEKDWEKWLEEVEPLPEKRLDL